MLNVFQRSLGTAILLITHNLALVYQNAENVAVMYGGKIVEMTGTKRVFRTPLHPYTVKLLNSIPAAGRRGTPLDTITGFVPPATDYPEGCRFSGRCPREMEGCSTMEPHLIEKDAGHIVACHLYDTSFMRGKDSKPLKSEGKRVYYFTPRKEEKQVLLEVRGLKKHYPIRKGLLKGITGYVKAVDGIDFTIKRGATLALVGESGCGKTTAGKTITQLLKPTAGDIVFNGRNIANLPESVLRPYRSLMQIIFQDPYSSLDPRMMVGETIEEGIKALKPGMDRGARIGKVVETMRLVGLAEEMAYRYPHEFSGGQRQRIGIARALAVDPEFIVCDEAVSALDVSVQAQVLNLLKSIQLKLEITYLFITHDLSVVEYIADEVAVMYDGRIVEHKGVEELFSSPAHPYTKKLLGAVPRPVQYIPKS